MRATTSDAVRIFAWLMRCKAYVLMCHLCAHQIFSTSLRSGKNMMLWHQEHKHGISPSIARMNQ